MKILGMRQLEKVSVFLSYKNLLVSRGKKNK
jgi:hypothetical protein